MSIEDRLKEKQPDVYKMLMDIRPKPLKITEADIRECMGPGAWKRKGGAMKQVRW